MEEKTVKPYGVLRIGEELSYYLLEPYTQRNVFSDGTFEFLVVPFFIREFQNKIYTPRFVRTTEFNLEYSDWPEITIKVSELEE